MTFYRLPPPNVKTKIVLTPELRRWLKLEIDRRMRERVQRTGRTEREFERTLLGESPRRVLSEDQRERDAARKRKDRNGGFLLALM